MDSIAFTAVARPFSAVVAERVLDARTHAAVDELGGLCRHRRAQPFTHDLGVPRFSEQPGDPPELVANTVRDIPVHERPERRERAAQPAHGDPELMDAVEGVTSYVDVTPFQDLDLLVETRPWRTAPTGPFRRGRGNHGGVAR